MRLAAGIFIRDFSIHHEIMHQPQDAQILITQPMLLAECPPICELSVRSRKVACHTIFFQLLDLMHCEIEIRLGFF